MTSKTDQHHLQKELKSIYNALHRYYGPTHWWPGDSPFEVVVGAILTQNTAWPNVEKAIATLKSNHMLSPRSLLAAPIEQLENTIRSAGYYHQKAERLRRFCYYLLEHYDGSIAKMSRRPLYELREELMNLNGIGPETADDILLYACEKPIFVVDAYTKRILFRCGLIPEKIRYENLQQLIQDSITPEIKTYKEFHGLIVWLGKDFCRKIPHCQGCPLAKKQHTGTYPCQREKY